MIRTLSMIGLAAFLSLPLSAHEFWLEPSASRAGVDEEIPITIAVGQDFSGDTIPYIPDNTVRFDTYGPGGKVEPAGAAFAADPGGVVRPAGRPGLYIVAYQNRGSRAEIDAETFNEYLATEGLDHVLAARRAAGTLDRPGLEFYTRFPKTWVLAGDNVAAGRWAVRPSRLTFELVPLTNPFVLRPGDLLTLQALYRGEPIANIQLNSFTKRSGGRIQAVRTDADGRATVSIDRAGRWLFAAVHAIPAPHIQDVDWESFWTSLTLDVPAR